MRLPFGVRYSRRKRTPNFEAVRQITLQLRVIDRACQAETLKGFQKWPEPQDWRRNLINHGLCREGVLFSENYRPGLKCPATCNLSAIGHRLQKSNGAIQ